jgi:hypothetical protein
MAAVNASQVRCEYIRKNRYCCMEARRPGSRIKGERRSHGRFCFQIREGGQMLLDERERLCQSQGLMQLLTYYAEQNLLNPETWLDRLMQIDGADAHDLVRWHGELIAFGWIEQNTGHTPACKEGTVASCYRVTAAGRRALREAQSSDDDAEQGSNAATVREGPFPRARTPRAARKPKETAVVQDVP